MAYLGLDRLNRLGCRHSNHLLELDIHNVMHLPNTRKGFSATTELLCIKALGVPAKGGT